jgi:flagellar biosynthesis protein FlhB
MAEHDQDSKTEEPTPKQRQKFRDEGNIAKGRDISSVVSLATGTGAIVLAWPLISNALAGTARMTLSRMETSGEIGRVMLLAGKAIVIAVAPVALAVLFFGVAAEISQVGFNFTLKPLRPKFSKFNPLPSIPKLFFSGNTGIELVKSFAKVAVIGFLAVRVLLEELDNVGRLAGLSSNMLLYKLGMLALRILLHVGVALIILAILDLLIERYRHHQRMKMTKQEVKQEHKDVEGDPKVKHRIRSKQVEMVRKRILENVASADVVVVNPTHYSVAIAYNMSTEPAPKIVGMGKDDLAMKIREIARQNSVPVVSNPPLARGLFAKGKLGAYIPPEYYRAVASILAWVYSITGRVA